MPQNLAFHWYFSAKIVQVETKVDRTLVHKNLDDFYPGFCVITQVSIAQKVINREYAWFLVKHNITFIVGISFRDEILSFHFRWSCSLQWCYQVERWLFREARHRKSLFIFSLSYRIENIKGLLWIDAVSYSQYMIVWRRNSRIKIILVLKLFLLSFLIRMARLLADNITKTINNGDLIERSDRPTVGQDRSIERPKVNVFPYSIFYVFYEQYLTMFEDTLRSLGISIGAVFIVTFILSGFDLMTSVVTILVIIMILVNLGKQVEDL